MHFGKMNMFRNLQVIPQPNQVFRPPVAPGQFGGDDFTRMSGQGLQRFSPMMGGQGSLSMPPGLGRPLNGLGGGLGGTQGMREGNLGWDAGLQGVGAQGYSAPSYQAQGYAQQQLQRPMLSSQGYPSQGLPSQGYSQQGYALQRYNQGYGVQTPVQPAWEEPKKGGIKGFISNLMAKFK